MFKVTFILEQGKPETVWQRTYNSKEEAIVALSTLTDFCCSQFTDRIKASIGGSIKVFVENEWVDICLEETSRIFINEGWVFQTDKVKNEKLIKENK